MSRDVVSSAELTSTQFTCEALKGFACLLFVSLSVLMANERPLVVEEDTADDACEDRRHWYK
jgi:hypothetical protein